MAELEEGFAVFKVREDGESFHLRVPRPLEFPDAAASASIHIDIKQIVPGSSFREFFNPAEIITGDEFDAAVSQRMENTGVVTGAFELDFERGEFSAFHIMDGWKSFRMEDVCDAMKKLAALKTLDRDEKVRVLTEQLDGKELRYDPLSAPRFSVLHVTSHGESHYSLTDAPAVFPEVAETLRRYLGMSCEDKPPSFDLCYTGRPISADEFDTQVTDFLKRRTDAAGVYDVNLDSGFFCVLRAGQGWERYTVSDVCHAAWTASHEPTRIAREKRFDQEVAQRKSTLIPPAIFDHAAAVQSNDLRLAVFHVTEKQEDTWFCVHGPLESVYAADVLRKYLSGQPSPGEKTFGSYFAAARPMSRNDYEWCTANLLGHGDIVTQVYDLNLDTSVFAFLQSGGWKNYSVELACDAALKSSDLYRLSPIPENRRFLDRITGQEIPREELEIYIRGDRRLDPGEISFSDSVEQMGGMLNFYMDVCFPPDTVLGTFVCTSENDDYVNVYANYDLVRDALCGELDVMLWRGDGDCLPMRYRLSREEKEMLLPKLAEYCQRDTGMTLTEWREQYLAEQQDEAQLEHTPEDGMEQRL